MITYSLLEFFLGTEKLGKNRASKKNNDLNATMNHFLDLTKAFAKSEKVVKQTGIPCFIVRELVEVEAYTAEKWSDKEFRKKLSKVLFFE